MNKNLFINIITALQEQYDDDLAKAFLMGKVLDYEANPYDNSKLSDAIFKLLRLYFKDKTDDIEIFCWEQNFGRMNNVSIEKLWDFLQEPTRMKNNWDDEENDATYSKKDLEFETTQTVNYLSKRNVPVIEKECDSEMLTWFKNRDKKSTEVSDLHKVITHTYEQIEKKRNDDLNDIEVKDFVIISPLKKR